jgi:hypothetical protein
MCNISDMILKIKLHDSVQKTKNHALRTKNYELRTKNLYRNCFILSAADGIYGIVPRKYP